MAVNLYRIEDMLRRHLGTRFLKDAPDLPYEIDRLLMRFMRTGDTLPQLLGRLQDLLFTTVYLRTNCTLRVCLDSGVVLHVTREQLYDLADRLLALSYGSMHISPTLQDALYDLSRYGSYAAMRTLLARFSLEQEDHDALIRVLTDNDALQ